MVRALWVGFGLGIMCFYFDSLLAFEGQHRLAIGIGVAAAVLATALLTVVRLGSGSNREKRLARMVESESDQMNNELVNAIDFEQRLTSGKTEKVSTELMNEAVVLGVNKFETVEDLNSLEPPTFRGEIRVLWCVLAIWTAAGILFYSWFFAEIPRYLDPFGDHPPYSPTKFIVDPSGAAVDYGDDLKINVTAKGMVPEELTLVIKHADGGVINEVPMFDSGDGRFFQTIENIRSDMVYFARIERGRSKYYNITLSKTPRFESVHLRYAYPEYTTIPERETVLTDGIIKGYRDTRVTMTVTSNRPLSKGAVTVGERTFTGQANGKNSVDVEFDLKEKGEYSVAITDTEGHTSDEQLSGKITILNDDGPSIAIVSPGINSFATPTAKVPILIEAHDDLGIRRISFYRNHNDSADARKILFEEKQGDKFVRSDDIFDLEDLGLRPGDTIDYYATVTDSLPDAPQTAASQSLKLQIISQEEYAKFLQTQMTAEGLRLKYDQIMANIDEIVESQAQLEQETKELQDSLGNSQEGGDSEKMQNRLAELAKRQGELAEKSRALAEQLEKEADTAPVFDIEKEYKKALAQFAGRLSKAQEHMDSGASNIEKGKGAGSNCSSCLGAARKDQKEALAQLGQEMQEMKDKIQQANKEIEKMLNLMADVEMFKQLYLAQKELARQTWSLKDIDNPDFEQRVRLKELAENEAAIEGLLTRLKQDLRDHAEEIKEEYPKVAGDAAAIAKDIEDRLICEAMQDASLRLNEGSGIMGHPRVRQALEQMEAMISFCKSTGGQGQSECEFRLKISMSLDPGNTLSQLSKGLGTGAGMGLMGAMGRGAAGYAGGQSDFAVYGDNNQVRESNISGVKWIRAEVLKEARQPDPLSGNIEELASSKDNDMEFEAIGDNRMMAEYSRLIEAYFRRMAEEE
jgi:hypothetical protein